MSHKLEKVPFFFLSFIEKETAFICSGGSNKQHLLAVAQIYYYFDSDIDERLDRHP